MGGLFGSAHRSPVPVSGGSGGERMPFSPRASYVALEFGFRHSEVLGHDPKLGLPEFNSGVAREHLGVRSSTQLVVRALAVNFLPSQLCQRAENSFNLRHV